MFRNVTTTLSQMKSYNEWIIFTNNTAVHYSSDLTQSSPFVSFGRLSFKVSSWTSPCLHLSNLVSRRPHCGNQGSIWMCHATPLKWRPGVEHHLEVVSAHAGWPTPVQTPVILVTVIRMTMYGVQIVAALNANKKASPVLFFSFYRHMSLMCLTFINLWTVCLSVLVISFWILFFSTYSCYRRLLIYPFIFDLHITCVSFILSSNSGAPWQGLNSKFVVVPHLI